MRTPPWMLLLVGELSSSLRTPQPLRSHPQLIPVLNYIPAHCIQRHPASLPTMPISLGGLEFNSRQLGTVHRAVNVVFHMFFLIGGTRAQTTSSQNTIWAQCGPLMFFLSPTTQITRCQHTYPSKKKGITDFPMTQRFCLSISTGKCDIPKKTFFQVSCSYQQQHTGNEVNFRAS